MKREKCPMCKLNKMESMKETHEFEEFYCENCKELIKFEYEKRRNIRKVFLIKKLDDRDVEVELKREVKELTSEVMKIASNIELSIEEKKQQINDMNMTQEEMMQIFYGVCEL